ncbi:MAG: glutathione peroxidase [Pseudanabaenaceae cyanobacterium bins.68]|nr:glutathione peroxidase [Pseudanabaenaceae cyanobacterium bins.68]
MTSLYDFNLKNINGEPTDLAKYKGKVCLIVNVASQCGYTKQYKGLEELYRQYKDQGLVILGVPSNDFGAQEPGSEAEIMNFCSTRYDVTFDMFSKVPVKGADKVDLYKYLTETTNNQVQWNFNKFLVNKEGEVVKYFPSSVAPDSPELVQAIEVLL